MRIEPFRVAIPEMEIADCARLAATRWPDDFANADWGYGVEAGWLRGIVEYWRDGFDWRAQEAEINALPQFCATIEGLPIHFVHLRSGQENAIPLIITYGWPWTCWDWKDVVAALRDGPFDLVVPSLPGFGFSSPLQEPMTYRRVAGPWVKRKRCFAAL